MPVTPTSTYPMLDNKTGLSLDDLHLLGCVTAAYVAYRVFMFTLGQLGGFVEWLRVPTVTVEAGADVTSNTLPAGTAKISLAKLDTMMGGATVPW